VLFSAAILQTTVMPRFALWGVRPDLMLLVVVSWSLLRGTKEGLQWALGGGLLLDLLSGGPFGAATLSLALSSVVASLGEVTVSRGTAWLPVAASLMATALYDLTYMLVLQLAGRPVLWGLGLARVIVPSMALNGLATYPTYWTLRWLNRRVGIEKIEW
jgi:rod shape-determining protein MreD